MTDNAIPEKQLEKYYRKDPEATDAAVLRFLKESRDPQMIVYGAKAVNAYLPAWLDKATRDWDILTDENAEGLARKLERKLDTHYGGDFFAVESAVHEGTFRIRSKVTGETVADITLQDRQIAFKEIGNVNYASLEFLEGDAERTLANPEAAFRHRKDRDTLQRIAVHKKVKVRERRKRKSRKEDPFPAFHGLR